MALQYSVYLQYTMYLLLQTLKADHIQMCVDLSHLNRYVKHGCYHSATPAQAVADITAE